MRVGLRIKYMLVFATSALFIVVVLAIVSLLQFRTTINHIMQESAESFESEYLRHVGEKARILVSFLAADLRNPLYNYDMEEIFEVLKTVSSMPHVAHVLVYDGSGQIVHDGSREDILLLDQVLDDPVSRRAVASKNFLIQMDGDVLDASQPIVIQNQILGGIRVGFSLEPMKRQIAMMQDQLKAIENVGFRRSILLMCYVVIGFVAGGSILAYVIAQRLTKPIMTLSRAAGEIGEGRYDIKIPVRRSSEIGDLADSLERMAGKIQDTQTQLIQSEKLSSLGLLASGVAHEINNPLSGVLTLLRLRRKAAQEEEERQDYEDMIAACEHIGIIVRDLLTFSRESREEFSPLNVNEAVIASISFVGYQLQKAQVKVHQQLADNLPFILGDKGKIQQIVVNMLTNARDAMPEGGDLTITTKASGEFVLMEFADTGCGMDPATLEKIYDPFFTTKDVGKGTGLGLAVSHGIVQKHHGRLEVQSRPGEGTRFSIWFPALKSEELV